MNGIFFPGLNIFLENVPRGFTIFGIFIPLYAVCITLGFILALQVARIEGKRTGCNDDDYLDYFLVMVIPSILGARIYYILFNLDRFTGTGKSVGGILLDMINIRNGGLAIYGGLIVGTAVSAIFAKKRHINLPLFGDNICMGILVGQILGRWGNFFNRECFGAYTDGPFRMAIPDGFYSKSFYSDMVRDGIITQQMRDNTEIINGFACITVHPTFIYEGLWNLALLIFIFCYRKKKKFNGELSMLYVAGYGLGRFWIEGLRTDSLMIGPLKVSQVVAVICVLLAVGVIIYNLKLVKKRAEVGDKDLKEEKEPQSGE